jgi:hypothetical protein
VRDDGDHMEALMCVGVELFNCAVGESKRNTESYGSESLGTIQRVHARFVHGQGLRTAIMFLGCF